MHIAHHPTTVLSPFLVCFLALLCVLKSLGGRMTYGFHLVFHKEHNSDICFGVVCSFYGQNIIKSL